jgi:uncharacterized protein YoxC
MESYNQYLLAILLISAAMLCIALIFYVKRIVKSVEELKSEIKNLNLSLNPLIKSTVDLTKNLNDFSIELKEQLKVTKKIIDDIKMRVEKIIEFEEKIRTGMENYTQPFIANLNALRNGINVFWKKFKER